MSEAGTEILSRDEIDAILSALDEDGDFKHVGPATRSANASWRALPLARALREYGADRARALATLHQRPFSFSLISIESAPAGEFAASMLDADRPALVEFRPSGSTGALTIGRSMLFGWLGLAFGGRPDPETPIPTRLYSRIEERFLRRCIGELASTLAPRLCMTPVPELSIGDLCEPSQLPDLCAPRLVVASFDVRGFGESTRFRIAIPDEFSVGSKKRRITKPSSELREHVLDVPVHLHAELGVRQSTLGAVRQLQVGDVLTFDPLSSGEVILRLEGKPKFRAIRGKAGARMAVQISEKL